MTKRVKDRNSWLRWLRSLRSKRKEKKKKGSGEAERAKNNMDGLLLKKTITVPV